MKTPFRVAMATAVPRGRRIALPAVVLVGLLTGACAASTLPSTAAPTATATPTPGPTVVPTSSAAAVQPLPPSGALATGTYRTDFEGEGVFITFTLPAGWSSAGGGVLRADGNPPNGMAFTAWQIGTVYSDPCRWQNTATKVDGTVDNLVVAFVAQKRGSTVTPVDVTIDGFQGKQIDLMVPLDVTVSACDEGEYKSWTDLIGGDRYNQGPGQHDLLDIIAVNGKTLVIQRSFYPANTTADLAQLQAIVDSIKVTP